MTGLLLLLAWQLSSHVRTARLMLGMHKVAGRSRRVVTRAQAAGCLLGVQGIGMQ
jgi:hypothetical protein